MLNPKHPSASFASPARPAESNDAAPSGPAAFQALATSGSAVATAAVYPEAPAPPVHHDWLHWQPKQSALDDEAMVNNVLGAVAELKSGGSHTESLLGKSRTTAQSAAAEEATRKASAGQENSYLKGLDFGDSVPAPPPRADDREMQENPYLASVDLAPAKPKPSLRQHDSTDYLASFSWDDKPEKPAANIRRGFAAAAPLPEAGVPRAETSSGSSPSGSVNAKTVHRKNALLAWLGGDHPQGLASAGGPPLPPQPEEPAAPEEQHRNPYMSYLH